MAAEGGIKILTPKFKIFSRDMPQIGMLTHAAKHCHTMSDHDFDFDLTYCQINED